MGLFGRKKEIRFESIVIDRQRDVFRALEQRGWTLCTDPFKFELEKTTDKLRKEAMSMAKDLKAELLVEVWDPIYHNRPHKGLMYAAWRQMTPDEVQMRRMEEASRKRPDYSDSLGTAQSRPSAPQVEIAREDMEVLDSFANEEVDAGPQLQAGKVVQAGDVGLAVDDGSIKAVAVDDPYHHRGEAAERLVLGDALESSEGPLFEHTMQLELGTPDTSDPTEGVDAMALMMEAASGPPTPRKAAEPREDESGDGSG